MRSSSPSRRLALAGLALLVAAPALQTSAQPALPPGTPLDDADSTWADPRPLPPQAPPAYGWFGTWEADSVSVQLAWFANLQAQGPGHGPAAMPELQRARVMLLTHLLVDAYPAGGGPSVIPTWPIEDLDEHCQVTQVTGNEPMNVVRSVATDLPRPDFGVSAWRPRGLGSTQPHWFGAFVRNVGDGDGGPLVVDFRVVNLDRGTFESMGGTSFSCMPSGSSVWITSPSSWMPRPGRFAFVVRVDPDDSILERSEDNNAFALPFTVLTGDLVAQGFAWPPACERPSGPPTCLEVWVSNKGRDPANNTTTLVAGYNDDLGAGFWGGSNGTVTVPPGGTTPIPSWLPPGLPGGRWRVFANVDPLDILIETREDNNFVSATFDWPGPSPTPTAWPTNTTAPATPATTTAQPIPTWP